MSYEAPELEVRAAGNEARFRERNERAEPFNAMHQWANPDMPDWTCECGRGGCTAPVQLTIEEYELVRAEPTHFLVCPSDEHVLPEVERVIARHERYWVVEKHGTAGEVSELLDPRA